MEKVETDINLFPCSQIVSQGLLPSVGDCPFTTFLLLPKGHERVPTSFEITLGEGATKLQVQVCSFLFHIRSVWLVSF